MTSGNAHVRGSGRRWRSQLTSTSPSPTSGHSGQSPGPSPLSLSSHLNDHSCLILQQNGDEKGSLMDLHLGTHRCASSCLISAAPRYSQQCPHPTTSFFFLFSFLPVLFPGFFSSVCLLPSLSLSVPLNLSPVSVSLHSFLPPLPSLPPYFFLEIHSACSFHPYAFVPAVPPPGKLPYDLSRPCSSQQVLPSALKPSPPRTTFY